MSCYSYFRPLLFSLSPEFTHNLAIKILQYNLLPKAKTYSYPDLETHLWGLDFPNILGLAAGFDKNAVAYKACLNQGLGFVEVGTVTPKAQIGNKKPRLFRLTEDESIINRMGFNNKGYEKFLANIKKRKNKGEIIGANIGKNKDTIDITKDYVFLLQKMYEFSDYITINISSPNTPGLRDLQDPESLRMLLTSIMHSKLDLLNQYKRNVPILIKIDADSSSHSRAIMAKIFLEYKIDGLIISNTTVSRPNSLKSKYSSEAGGLSGKSLYELSNQAIKDMYKLTEGHIPIIGVGGIDSAEAAYNKIKCGASLVQVYSGLIYHGLALVPEILAGVSKLLSKDGYKHISEAVGKGA